MWRATACRRRGQWEQRARGRHGVAPLSRVTEQAKALDGRLTGVITLTTVSVRSVAELAALTERGQSFTYLMFWGHQPERDGRPGRGCLSQWWPARFEVDGLAYPSAEHYMMWSKAVLFGDDETAQRILESGSPERAKALGRQVRGFQNETWQAHRFAIVVRGNLAKFGQHDPLKTYLVGTGERVLVEASPLDPVWGIGLAADDPRATDPAQWPGANLLGFALMDVRERLRVS